MNHYNSDVYVSDLVRANPFTAVLHANNAFSTSQQYNSSSHAVQASPRYQPILPGPSGCTPIPQTPYMYRRANLETYFPPIAFSRSGTSDPGVRISQDLLNSLYTSGFADQAKITGGRGRVLDVYRGDPSRQYKKLRVVLTWPGYAQVWEKEFSTNYGSIDNAKLLHYVLRVLEDAWNDILSNGLQVKRGYEAYRVGGLRLENLIVTGVVHRGGAIWQPEIWHS